MNKREKKGKAYYWDALASPCGPPIFNFFQACPGSIKINFLPQLPKAYWGRGCLWTPKTITFFSSTLSQVTVCYSLAATELGQNLTLEPLGISILWCLLNIKTCHFKDNDWLYMAVIVIILIILPTNRAVQRRAVNPIKIAWVESAQKKRYTL